MEENNVENKQSDTNREIENNDNEENKNNNEEQQDKNQRTEEIKNQSDNDIESNSTTLPENINWNGIITWGIAGLAFSIVLVFLVSLISGTLQFVLGRLLLFGILFFILGGGLRLLIEIFAPEVLGEDQSNDNITSDITNDENINRDENSINMDNNEILGSNINTSIDDQIETDPLWKKEDEEKPEGEANENEMIKKKYGGNDEDYLNVEGTDVVLPNNAEIMAESIRTMINKDED
jgi:hypothetical protein